MRRVEGGGRRAEGNPTRGGRSCEGGVAGDGARELVAREAGGMGAGGMGAGGGGAGGEEAGGEGAGGAG